MTTENRSDANVMDFGFEPTKNLTFRVQSQEFTAVGRVGAESLMDVLGSISAEGMTGARAVDTVNNFLTEVLVPESLKRMQEAMTAKDDSAISMPQLTKVVQWLVSELTGRPTASSGDSQDSAETTGDSSTGD